MDTFSPQRMLSFDLETTSANPFEARIVTSALVRIQGRDVDAQEMLADPGVEIPEGAQKVHGITTEYAREHGKPHDEVLDATIAAIQQGWKDGLTLIVFNASYDLTVLGQLRPGFVVTGPVFDPFVVDKLKDPYRKGKRTLTDLCALYDVKLDTAHEATSDALAAARIAWKQVRQWPELEKMPVDELMEFQAVGYYRAQESFKRYLEGKGSDSSDVNLSWPMQS
ncbi:DNA polymerase III subunit epsilon [Corynebacterium kalinowskii]|uniref:DNA polymerase III subunit epsilon n=1 Tax=Corynebacterium kalinowskii TaxID=2675216 RepID=A0A6B8VWZ1_9CORY|nr:3'-5' exonuclease [Corynebacterium kalinowskii]QGU01820.1 DNA polymerase III subunit epsilon [Corynebacterium kalinowskii]